MALAPRTVATRGQLPVCATAMVSAYRSENPTHPLADVLACVRIALLYLLSSFYGATTGEYGRQTTIHRLLNNSDDLEDVLNTPVPRPGDHQ